MDTLLSAPFSTCLGNISKNVWLSQSTKTSHIPMVASSRKNLLSFCFLSRLAISVHQFRMQCAKDEHQFVTFKTADFYKPKNPDNSVNLQHKQERTLRECEEVSHGFSCFFWSTCFKFKVTRSILETTFAGCVCRHWMPPRMPCVDTARVVAVGKKHLSAGLMPRTAWSLSLSNIQQLKSPIFH